MNVASYAFSCPLGYICDPEQNLTNSCNDIQRKVIEKFKFGDILGGIYCPENNNRIVNCDNGYYCPNASAMLPCPPGYYCPHKTRIPEISCPSCGEASTSFMRNDWGYYVVIPIFCLVVLTLLYKSLRRNKDKLQTRLSKMGPTSSKTKEDKEIEMHQRLLKMLLPQLETIQKKLNQHDLISIDDTGYIAFDQELLFDEIDIDKSEGLSYDELNNALDLKPGQLLEFISFINDMAGVPRGEEHVTKPPFVQFFLESFEHAINFDPSDEQAGHTFDRIVQDLGFPDANTVDIEDFHQTHLSDFLNESQINMLKGKFQSVLDIISTADNIGSKRSSVSFLNNSVTNALSRRLSDAMAFSYDQRRSSAERSSRPSVGRSNDYRRSTVLALEQEFLDTREGLTKSERIFCRCMFESLQDSELFDPKAQDLNQITNEIIDNLDFLNSGDVDTESLPEKLFEFLDEDQIEILRRKYEKLIISTKKNETEFENRRLSQRTFRRISSIFTREPSRELTKDLFCQFYATFLKEIKKIERLRKTSKRDAITLAFENLSLSVMVKDEPKYILDSVTGIVEGKAMTAILGGSGAGKTSLLNALCGRAYYGKVTGKIYVNGQPSSIDKHKSIVGFVPQDDTVYPELTVKENLMFAGKLQTSDSTKTKDIKELADETMASLGLTRVANSIVGDESLRGISGGEKKRVNIGLELMSRPSLLFLDEPTSGLDSSSAMLVMKSLQGLVDRNSMTICCVIHQPRRQIYQLFDSIILLGYGGKMVYHGPVNGVETYFNDLSYSLPVGENIADWLLDISTGSIDPEVESLKENQNSQNDEKGEPNIDTEGEDDNIHIAGEMTRVAQNMLMNSANLFRKWGEYYEKSFGTHDNEKSFASSLIQGIIIPEEEAPSFFHQTVTNIHRNIIVSIRQKDTKLTNLIILMGIVFFMSWLDGTVAATELNGLGININNEFVVLSSDDPERFSQGFKNIFRYASLSNRVQSYAMKVGIMASVLLGLAASKNFTDKQTEFFREAASGYNVNSYFLALHVTTFIEHFVMIFITALLSLWYRNSFTDGISFVLNYVFLVWHVIGWGFIFPFVVPLENVSIVTGLFMAFTGIQFSGQLKPVTYQVIYDQATYGLITGILCPIRYFVEQMAVAEFRTLPPQSGFTKAPSDGENFPIDKSSFHTKGMALLDIDSAMERSTRGWYWPFLRVFFVGLSLRLLSFCLLHMTYRPQQNKKPLKSKLNWNATNLRDKFVALIVIASFGVSTFFMVYFILN